MRTLRDPERGCPGIARRPLTRSRRYTIEEAYELADAIAREDMARVRDELGDLLFQVVFHARIAEERGCSISPPSRAAICTRSSCAAIRTYLLSRASSRLRRAAVALGSAQSP